VSDSAMQQTPFDNIDLKDLDGWIHYDSSRMCKEDNGEGWGGDTRDRCQESWMRFDNG